MREKTTDRLPPAVILGLCPTGLAAIRELGKTGVIVYGYDKCSLAVGYFSKFCHRIKGITDNTPEDLCKTLIEFSKQFSPPPVLIPTSDEYLDFACEYADQLKRFYMFDWLSREDLELFINKQKFYEHCEKHNVPYPAIFRPADRDSLIDISSQITYPAIIKPIYVHLWARQFGTRKVFKARNRHELVSRYDQLGEMKRNILIQEIVPGEDDQLYIFAAYFDAESKPHQIFTGRKIRQFPPGFGTTVLAESLQCDEITSQAVRLMQGIGYHGLSDIEFKYDSRKNSFKILEVNPRIGRWYSITTASNRYIISRAYENMTQMKLSIPRNNQQIYGIKWGFFYRDILSFYKLWVQKKITFREWYSARKDCDLDAVLEKGDIGPTFAYLGEMASKFIKLIVR